MTTTTAVAPPFTEVRYEIVVDADWNDAMPPLLEDGVALDLTGRTLELYIRPDYDNATTIKKLTSFGSAGIVIDDAAGGLASFYVERPNVKLYFPVGRWVQYLILNTPEPDPYDADSLRIREVWRGPLIVHPGRT